jgi:hypothetical protein
MSPGAVMRLVLGHGRRLTLLGIALGIAGALAVSRLMQQSLFDVEPVIVVRSEQQECLVSGADARPRTKERPCTTHLSACCSAAWEPQPC